MENSISSWQFAATPRLRLNSAKSRRRIFMQVFSAHVLIIFVPLILAIVEDYLHPAETMFQVDLSGPLSTGPEVGIPERIAPGSPTPDTKTETVEPEKPLPPEPDIPVPDLPQEQPPAPDTVPEEPSLRDLPKLPRPPEPKLRRLPKFTRPSPKPFRNLPAVKPPKPVAGNGIYNKNGRGGSNTNELVPIGSRDLAQKLGPQNNGTPGGNGAQDAQYPPLIGAFLKKLWEPPSNIFLDGRQPEVRILLVIAGDGRVISKQILSQSNIPAMDDSVRFLLRRIEHLPAPPSGKQQSIDIILRPED